MDNTPHACPAPLHLEHCHWCGAVPEIVHRLDGYTVRCGSPVCDGHDGFTAPTEAAAVQAWNDLADEEAEHEEDRERHEAECAFGTIEVGPCGRREPCPHCERHGFPGRERFDEPSDGAVWS